MAGRGRGPFARPGGHVAHDGAPGTWRPDRPGVPSAGPSWHAAREARHGLASGADRAPGGRRVRRGLGGRWRIALATGLEGSRFSPELRRGTPFRSHAIPGAILAGIVGKSALWATIATAASPRAGGLVSVAAGAVMMGWIVGEVAILRAPEARSPVEAVYFGVGAAMAGLGLVVARRA